MMEVDWFLKVVNWREFPLRKNFEWQLKIEKINQKSKRSLPFYLRHLFTFQGLSNVTSF